MQSRRRPFVLVVMALVAGCSTGQEEEATKDGDVVDATSGDTVSVDTSPDDSFVVVDSRDSNVAADDGEPAEDGHAGDAAVSDTEAVDAEASVSDTSDTAPVDTSVPADTAVVDAAPETPPWSDTAHVHIYIPNVCKPVTTSPASFDVPAGKTVKVSWHNHSADYSADVWASYGGGFLDLAPGATWNETYEHCFIKSTHTEYVDVSPNGSPSACGSFRVYFYCHAP